MTLGALVKAFDLTPINWEADDLLSDYDLLEE